MGVMAEMEHRRVRASDEERDYVLYLLQQAHGAGRIDIDEFEERQTKAFGARFTDEFIPLLDDLPEGREVVEALRPTPPPQQGPRILAPFNNDSQSLAILGGKDVVVGYGQRSFHLMSFLGGDNLDLTRAMGPGVVMVIQSESVLGGGTITVPPGVHVVDETSNILGGNSVRKKARGDGSNGTLVLRGICVLGGHTVKLA